VHHRYDCLIVEGVRDNHVAQRPSVEEGFSRRTEMAVLRERFESVFQIRVPINELSP